MSACGKDGFKFNLVQVKYCDQVYCTVLVEILGYRVFPHRGITVYCLPCCTKGTVLYSGELFERSFYGKFGRFLKPYSLLHLSPQINTLREIINTSPTIIEHVECNPFIAWM